MPEILEQLSDFFGGFSDIFGGLGDLFSGIFAVGEVILGWTAAE
ncbi:PorACj family cell wall channel-forming small protein [Corynebacterium dentalis]|nr:PorACj family cell wall channel-forming small protein [Corynebacterium dentalis]